MRPLRAGLLALIRAGGAWPLVLQGQPLEHRQISLPPRVSGYAIGVRDLLLIDSSRVDTLARSGGAFRPILVRMWYPADSSPAPTRRYMSAPVAGAWRSTLPVPSGFEAAITTNAVDDAPISRGKPRWPVLLFSHGRSFPVENYQLLLEQLATMGWIVVGISHPYEEAATELPDGRILSFQGPRWSADSLRGHVLQAVSDELVKDAALVLDWLGTRDSSASDPFRERLDLARGVGYFGHSLGGSAAAWTMQRDRRVVAAASWEGQVFREADRPLEVRGPLMLFIGSVNRREFMGMQFRPAPGGGPVYELVLNGAWHASVGDLLFLYAPYAPEDWHRRHRREMTALRANQITGDYLDEFFGHFLLGRQLDLLWPDSMKELEAASSSNYAEVELRVYSR